LPVVIKQGSGGVLFHEACGHGLEADLVGKGASVYRGKMGEMVASPLVTLIDDGTMSGEWGAIGIDDEGHPSQRNVLIELGGGSVDTASGDFVFGMVEAYLIENGEITEPLRESNLIGNGPQVLKDIDLLGNDFAMGNPGTCGKDGQGVPVGDGQPTLRVKSMTIGGTAA
jgi:TldD protein